MSELPGGYLWHYTSAAGLDGILTETRDKGSGNLHPRLWATHTGFLNDAMEVRLGKKIAEREMRKRLAEPYEYAEALHRAIGVMPSGSPRLITRSLLNLYAYTASLSGEGNDLSQWRAYCRGGGYAIGFPEAGLRAALRLHDPDFDLEPCLYRKKERQSAITKVLNEFSTTHRASSEYDDDDVAGSVAIALEVEIAAFCCRVKHRAFAAERESRIISVRPPRSICQRVTYRSVAGLLIPYVALKLPSLTDSASWSESQIVVGPTRFEDIAVAGARMRLAAALGLSDAKAVEKQVLPSGIPFREF